MTVEVKKAKVGYVVLMEGQEMYRSMSEQACNIKAGILRDKIKRDGGTVEDPVVEPAPEPPENVGVFVDDPLHDKRFEGPDDFDGEGE